MRPVKRVHQETNPILSTEAPQVHAILQQPDASLLERNYPNSSFAVLREQVAGQCDSSWRMIQSDHNIQFFIVHVASQPTISRSVVINNDLSWSVFVSGKQLASDETPALRDLPKHVASIDDLNALLERVKSSQICPGNPDQDFVDMIAKEGGKFLGADGELVATLDAS